MVPAMVCAARIGSLPGILPAALFSHFFNVARCSMTSSRMRLASSGSIRGSAASMMSSLSQSLNPSGKSLINALSFSSELA